jgi:hypothetical protein
VVQSLSAAMRVTVVGADFVASAGGRAVTSLVRADATAGAAEADAAAGAGSFGSVRADALA